MKEFSEHIGLAFWFCKRLGLNYREWDEVLQDCLIAVWTATRKYDEIKGEFSTYAVRCMEHTLQTYRFRQWRWNQRNVRIKGRQFMRQQVLFSSMSFGFLGCELFAREDHELRRLDDKEESERVWTLAAGVLDKRRYRVLRMRFEGEKTLKEVAKIEGITVERLRQIEADGIRHAGDKIRRAEFERMAVRIGFLILDGNSYRFGYLPPVRLSRKPV